MRKLYEFCNDSPICRALVLCCSVALVQHAQQPPLTSGARELFYMASSGKDRLPPVRPVAASARTPAPSAVHLGFRYNLLLISKNSSAYSIPSDRVLKIGECFAIEFTSNRSGYLYVLAKQSSGSWMPLLPSPEMADEKNVIDPGVKVRVPGNYCFEVHDPPGTESLFVVLSRDPRDFYELYQGIKGKSVTTPAPSPEPEPSKSETVMQLADSRMVNHAVADLAERFGSRDIVIRKVNQSVSGADPEGSVYVVNGSQKPTSSIVTQIDVRHR